MIIGGWQKFSLIDYPGKISAVVFTQGCNFRCSYCHNPELVRTDCFRKPIPEGEIIEFLDKRKGMLEGVAITGGEPLLQENIITFLRTIKIMGYSIKLDTNGSYPARLKMVIREKLIDYIAMDIKAPLEKYALVTGIKVSPDNIAESIGVIMQSGLDYHFRTTMGKSFLAWEDIKQICGLIKGARNYVLQKHIPLRGAQKPSDRGAEYGDTDIQNYQNMANSLIKNC